MNVEVIKVLNDHLSVLAQLENQNVAVYREINKVNRAIQMEIGAYTECGVKVDLEYQAQNNDVVTWDDENNELAVSGTLVRVSEVLQKLRDYSLTAVAKHFNLTEIQVSNVLCFAARVCENAVY